MAKKKFLKRADVVPGVLVIVNAKMKDPTTFRVKSVDEWVVYLEYESTPGHWVGGGIFDTGMLYLA